MATECKVVGLLRRPEFQQAVAVLRVSEKLLLDNSHHLSSPYGPTQSLHSLHGSKVREPVSQGMMEFQWTHWLQQLQKVRTTRAGEEYSVMMYCSG